ncbi:lysine N(6)-hydroxylase/L-ornithine N(5)-oxygenase family protein [Falsibacillus pallidus]|uniref:L-lysine N6-monooxygenase MbtG n=1 Tax=Falsibacillus pallidus TaxID=493781 RepID=A0A370GFZ7_9BACI|nr:SidA/IucD/PvdA family monooxygenase [Falsibacillus pallidus]RDI42240.1 lysine N6-hydroxylase [Falsibacillus pallidus]
MERKEIIDIIGIGIGPFNLGLAALLEDTEIKAEFFDQSPEFKWHPGMLIDGTDLQVPIIADLVTFANPQSKFTFLNYLHTKNRLYKFFFFNQMEIPRKEYNAYARWVVSQLDFCHFGKRVIDVMDRKDSTMPHYEVIIENCESGEREKWKAKHIVLGTGSTPLVPEGLTGMPEEDVFHSSQFLYRKAETQKAGSITVIGSGQSAAEIFLTLLKEQEDHDYHLTWFTRSDGMLQLESSKLGQELFSPDYIDFFHELPLDQRMEALTTLKYLRNGVEPATLGEIYDTLYHYSSDEEKNDIIIQPATEVKSIEESDGAYSLTCEQKRDGYEFKYPSEKVVMATGYKPNIPAWFNDHFKKQIVWEDEEKTKFKVTRDYRLVFKEDRENLFFTLTNLEHSHGSAATHLGLSVERNINIINAIAGKEIYKNHQDTVFSQFSMNVQK